MLPFTFKHMFELLLVGMATVLAKGTTQISTNYPSTNYWFRLFQSRFFVAGPGDHEGDLEEGVACSLAFPSRRRFAISWHDCAGTTKPLRLCWQLDNLPDCNILPVAAS